MSGQDGTGVAPGGVGSQESGTDVGASGGSGGAFSLGTGGIVGISVGISFAVIGIVIVWTLWYLTKKRQWNIRESIRRASRRFTGRRDTTTEHTSSRQSRANRRGTVMIKSPPPADTQSDVDLEKGGSPVPKPGWLASEKARSRSSSRENGPRR